MTIKIKKVTIEKDGTTLKKIPGGNILEVPEKLKGNLNVEVSKGDIKGATEVEIVKVSKSLQEKLYEVLSDIEDELNGIEKEEVGLSLYNGKGEKVVEIKKDGNLKFYGTGQLIANSKEYNASVVTDIVNEAFDKIKKIYN